MKKEIVLSETRTDVSYEQKLARIEANGDLVIEYYDRSPVALKLFGDSDYEHWTTVSAEQKDTLLLELVKDKFSDCTSIQDWLRKKGLRINSKAIPSLKGAIMKTMNEIVESFFDDSSLTNGSQPNFVLIIGGVGAGKTTIRKKDYAPGYVVLDGGEIFRLIGEGGDTNDIQSFLPAIDEIGSKIIKRAIAEKRNIVMEIIGDDLVETETIMKTMNDRGYAVHIFLVKCGTEEAYLRHTKAVQEDKLYLSCYFTKDLHTKWVIADN